MPPGRKGRPKLPHRPDPDGEECPACAGGPAHRLLTMREGPRRGTTRRPRTSILSRGRDPIQAQALAAGNIYPALGLVQKLTDGLRFSQEGPISRSRLSLRDAASFAMSEE